MDPINLFQLDDGKSQPVKLTLGDSAHPSAGKTIGTVNTNLQNPLQPTSLSAAASSGSPAGMATTPTSMTKVTLTATAGPVAPVARAVPPISPPSAPNPQKLPAEKAAPVPVEGGQSFANIFTDARSKEKGSKIVATILAQKDQLQNLKPLLGTTPTLEKSIEQDRIARAKGKLRLIQFFFTLVFLGSLGMLFYFHSQLSDSFNFFGPNTFQRLVDTNTSLKAQQTKLNQIRYLEAELALHDFSYQSDRFFSSLEQLRDPHVTSDVRTGASKDIEESQKALPDLLQKIRSALNQDLVIKTYPTDAAVENEPDQIPLSFEQDLKSSLSEERKKFSVSSNRPEDLQNLKLIDNASKLVGNQAIIQVLQGTSVDNFKKELANVQTKVDPQSEKTLRDLVGKILQSTKSDLAVIADIKGRRIDWSRVISYIEEETKNVDKTYGQPGSFAKNGGVVYTGYEFDTSTNKIVLSGLIKTKNGYNFKLMSNLIDQLELSPHFADADMRSFPKNKTGSGSTDDEGFVSNFKISLRLETPNEQNAGKSISLDGKKNVSVTGVPVNGLP